jgi:hypothetical protein
MLCGPIVLATLVSNEQRRTALLWDRLIGEHSRWHLPLARFQP